jgi:hypothetical protein
MPSIPEMPSSFINNFGLPTPLSSMDPFEDLSGTSLEDNSWATPILNQTIWQGETLQKNSSAIEMRFQLHDADYGAILPLDNSLFSEIVEYIPADDTSHTTLLSPNNSASPRSEKRRKLPRNSNTKKQLSTSDHQGPMLSEWIAAEDERRRRLEHNTRTMSWSREWITSSTSTLTEHSPWDKLILLCLHRIGDSDAIVHVKNLIVQGRTYANEKKQAAPSHRLTFSERFQTIRRLENDLSYLRLLWRLHVVRLVEECQERCPKRTNAFFNSTPESISQAKKRRRGNPQNLAEAQLTERMMHQAFPDLHVANPQYKRERRYI